MNAGHLDWRRSLADHPKDNQNLHPNGIALVLIQLRLPLIKLFPLKNGPQERTPILKNLHVLPLKMLFKKKKKKRCLRERWEYEQEIPHL